MSRQNQNSFLNTKISRKKMARKKVDGKRIKKQKGTKKNERMKYRNYEMVKKKEGKKIIKDYDQKFP